tara:strand:- start:469 stop:729 length:261 start_codon:yes stop_codon:yes gene_type:complete
MSADNVALVDTYMKMRNSFKHGFLKYDYFRNIIRYITGIKKSVNIRAIFQKMLEQELIEKHIIIMTNKKKTLRYRHNPYHIDGYTI